MITMQSWDGARKRKKALRKDTFEGHVTDFIATHEKGEPGPQAFLVEQAANWVTPPHFHLEHQFQVITAGGGAIGRHAVGPLAVHFAARETGYGPISAGPDGVSYMTLRAVGDSGAWYLHKPGSRERMRAGLKREQQHGAPARACTAAELARLAQPEVEELIAARADGLAAYVVRMGSGQHAVVPSRHPHGGRHYVLTQGSASLDGQSATAMAVVFASADEPQTLRAQARGAEILILQFPTTDTAMETVQ